MIAPSSWPSPARDCVVTTENRIVIPNECEGSKTDFSLWSKQGFLPAVEMTEGPTGTMFPVLRHSLERRARRLFGVLVPLRRKMFTGGDHFMDCASLDNMERDYGS